MQHLVRLHVSGQLGNGNKVGSPMSTFGGLTNAGYGGLPEGTCYSVVTLGGRVTCTLPLDSFYALLGLLDVGASVLSVLARAAAPRMTPHERGRSRLHGPCILRAP